MTSGANGHIVYLKDYQEPDYKVSHVDLEFDIRNGETFVTAKLQVKKNGAHNRPLVLNGEELSLQSVAIDGIPLTQDTDYTVDDKSLTLKPWDDEFTVETRVRIVPETNTQLSGLYKSGDTYCTQCESEGFRRITYYVDRPDNMATFTTKVIGDQNAAPVLLSNGNMTDSGKTPDGRHFTTWHDPFPKPCYLFALVAADLDMIEDKYTTGSGRDVTLRIYAEKKDVDKLDFAMDSLKKSMKWDEDTYGLEYDLDLFNIVAVDAFNFGAMENKSLNIFNTSAVLAHPETQTDARFDYVRGVVAHEYFHNWSGNRVTCRDWFQLTLKEGLTVFRDSSFSADMGSAVLKRIADVSDLRAHQFKEDSGALAHPIRPDHFEKIENFYTSTVYEKGAEVIRMMHTMLGAADYRKATDLYFSRHDGQAVTCEDFVQCMKDASGRDLTQFWNWYTQSGTPEVKAEWTHDANGKFTLTLEQSCPSTPGQPAKKPFHIPVSFGIVGPDGKDVGLDASGTTTQILELTKTKQSFTFDNIPAGSVPSILRNFSAPVVLKADYTDAELQHLMVHDSDGFNQYEAGQEFVKKHMLAQVERAEKGLPVTVDPAVVQAMRDIAKRKDMDTGLKAWMLSLPGFSELAQQRPEINPDAIRAVTKAFRETVAMHMTLDCMKIYCTLADFKKPFDTDVKSVSERSLKNTALSYLAATGVLSADELAFDQYRSSNNMTDRLAGYSALMGMKSANPALQKSATDDFYNRFKNDALPINSWFSVQISSAGEKALDVAKELVKHPQFNALNPNRARAVYGAFAGTAAGFHRADGEGYKFLRDFIADVDGKNPMLAARMADFFAEWKRFAEPWKTAQKDALVTLATRPAISELLGEKLRKMLGPDYPAPGAGAGAAPVAKLG